MHVLPARVYPPAGTHAPAGRLYVWILAMFLAACARPEAAPTAAPTPLRVPPPTATAIPFPTPLPPTATTLPSATPTPTITPTPAPTVRQLTSGGCCVQPFWSPDGSEVWFIDKPEGGASGIWGVSLAGGPPRLVTERLGTYSADFQLRAYPDGGRTYIERADGERWVAQREGRAISFAPDGRRIAWQVALSGENFDRRIVEVWTAEVDGSGAQRIARLVGGGLSGWLPDSTRLLVTTREKPGGDVSLAALDPADGSLVEIARGGRLRGVSLSPQGGWMAYMVAFSGDPAQDGLWVVRTDGGGARRLEVFGAYRWGGEGRLWVMPLEMDRAHESHRLLEINAASGQTRALTDPAVTPFRVTGGDWAIAPDGRRMVFVSAADRNLWLLELPSGLTTE